VAAQQGISVIGERCNNKLRCYLRMHVHNITKQPFVKQ